MNLVKEVINNLVFYLKLQLLPAILQESGKSVFQQDCHSAQDTL